MKNKNINLFDKKDKTFFSIVLKYKKNYEDIMTKSLEYQINLNQDILELKKNTIEATKNNKKEKFSIILLGMYNTENNTYIHYKGINEILFDNLDKNYDLIDFFGSKTTIEKIFLNQFISIDKKTHYAIPYFVAIMNPAFNLVRFENENGKYYFYALIKFGYEDKLNFNKFLKDMEKYKKLF